MTVQDGSPSIIDTAIDLTTQFAILMFAFLTMEVIRRTLQVLKHGWSWNKLKLNFDMRLQRAWVILLMIYVILFLLDLGPVRVFTYDKNKLLGFGVTTSIYCLFFNFKGTLTTLEKHTMRLERKTNVGHVVAQSFHSMLVKSLIDPIGRRAILDHFDRHGISSGLQTLAKFIFVPDLASDFYWPHLNLRGFDLAMMNGLTHVDKDEKELVDMPEPVTYKYNNHGKDRLCEYCVLKVKDLELQRYVYFLYFDNRPLESIRTWMAEELENLHAKYKGDIPSEITGSLRQGLRKQVNNFFHSLNDMLQNEPSMKGKYHVIKFGGSISEVLISIVNLFKRVENGILPAHLDYTKVNL